MRSDPPMLSISDLIAVWVGQYLTPACQTGACLPTGRGLPTLAGVHVRSVPLVRRAWSIVHVRKLAWTLRSLGCRGGRRVVALADQGHGRVGLARPANTPAIFCHILVAYDLSVCIL
jgi:hypothetical protein